ncbi:hypothetical protein KIW84_055074 [Lathyrus oleraceus]|uniref:Aminotransferase-like plant mobile domain-containing protein n=1 Tax=Pisum sativum TaxID=3888 RepID=A0A9D4WX31_PEA|nr:hypothetical protein KIW84_055074 [Pisum sativum]
MDERNLAVSIHYNGTIFTDINEGFSFSDTSIHLFKIHINSDFHHLKDRIEKKLQSRVEEIIYRHPLINGEDDSVFYVMTPIENDEQVKSMFQCHITFSQLSTIEIYVRLFEHLETYPTQSIQSHQYGMSQTTDDEPTQNNEPFIPNEEVGGDSEDDQEEVRFEDLFVVRRRGADGRIPVRTLDRGASSSAAAAEPTGYPRGSYDMSLLVKYEHHVARHIWFGEERGPKKELKVVGHGLKLTSRVPLALPPQMESWVSRSGLASLQRTSLNKIDTNLVSAFVERWHLETSSFHMPFGEMSITLDDVACLLHLPIRGIFWSPQDVTEELAVELAVDYLGVSQGQAQSHVRSCRGSYYKLEWLYDLFVHHRAASSWAYATRAYILMLVGSTIFVDKTFTLVEARYLLLFRDLDGCSGYSWGAAALVTLYRYLGDASMYSCKQLGGYPTLLQCWIHEYFPTVGKRGENWNPAENCGLPRAMRWSYRQGVLKVDDLRPILDELTPTDVIWRPFEDHRAWRVFDEICLYRGCLKWGETVVPYLPDKCLRQFGYR